MNFGLQKDSVPPSKLLEFDEPKSFFVDASNDSSFLFIKCSSLIQVKFAYPSSVLSINDYAFSNCISLEQIAIPSSVIEIKESAFSECSSLALVSFDEPSSIKVIDFYAFNRCTSLYQINIPSPIKIIKSYAFYECPLLMEMSIGDSIKKVGNNVFNSYIVINLV